LNNASFLEILSAHREYSPLGTQNSFIGFRKVFERKFYARAAFGLFCFFATHAKKKTTFLLFLTDRRNEEKNAGFTLLLMRRSLVLPQKDETHDKKGLPKKAAANL